MRYKFFSYTYIHVIYSYNIRFFVSVNYVLDETVDMSSPETATSEGMLL